MKSSLKLHATVMPRISFLSFFFISLPCCEMRACNNKVKVSEMVRMSKVQLVLYHTEFCIYSIQQNPSPKVNGWRGSQPNAVHNRQKLRAFF